MGPFSCGFVEAEEGKKNMVQHLLCRKIEKKELKFSSFTLVSHLKAPNLVRVS